MYTINDIYPVIAIIVEAIQNLVILHKEPFGTRRMHRDFMNTLPELRIPVGHELCADASILRCPSNSAVIGPVNAAGGDCYIHTLFVAGIEDDSVQRKTSIARHPAGAVRMIEQTTNQRPCFSRVAGFEEGGWFHAAIEDVRFILRAERD